MIYVPLDNTYNKCYVVQDNNTIRAYDTIPTNNSNYNYRDYFVNSHYLFNNGSGSWLQSSTLPLCINSSNITHDFYYRNDFADICIIFFIYAIIIFGIPYKLLKTFRKGLH